MARILNFLFILLYFLVQQVITRNNLCNSCNVNVCQICAPYSRSLQNSNCLCICKSGYHQWDTICISDWSIAGFIIGIIFVSILIILAIIKYKQKKRILRRKDYKLYLDDEMNVESSARSQLINKPVKEPNKCRICSLDRCNYMTQCQHYFHGNCIKEWLLKNNDCPECKKIIVKK